MPTALFSVKLMGRGTAEIESLPSYIHRCSIAHGSNVGSLLQTVERLIPNTHLCLKGKLKAKNFKPHDLVRPGKLVDELVYSFSEATGEPLDSSVLWILNTVLGRSQGEVVKGFRWCPECFGEMQRLGFESYFKLIWHMSSVAACHIHRTPLIQRCEACDCDQTSYKKVTDIGYCQECGESLSIRISGIDSDQLISSWEDLGNDVVQLFHELSLVDARSLPEDGPYKSVNDLLDYYWRIDREDIFYGALTRDQMIALSCRDKSISMLTARRIAFRLGVPLFAFIAGEASQTSGVLDHGLFCTLPEGYLDVKHKARKDHVDILKKLECAINEIEIPITAKKLCQLAGVSTGYLAYRYPQIYKDVVQRRKNYDEEEHLKAIYRAQAAALEYFFQERYADQPKSRRQAYKQLREETGLPKWTLKNAIQIAYEALNGNNV
ncbi:MAG: TniQ family protein [Oleispira sp.]|nr:TniQ family protein [Oleispira sp.]